MTITLCAIGCTGPKEETWEYLPECVTDVERVAALYEEHRHIALALTGGVIALETVMTHLRHAQDTARANGKRLVVRITGHAGLSIMDGQGRQWFFYLGRKTKDAVLWWPILLAWMQQCAADGIQVALMIDSCHARPQKRRALAVGRELRVKGINAFTDQTDGATFDVADSKGIPRKCLLMGACKRQQVAYGAIGSVYTSPPGNGIFDTGGESLWGRMMNGQMRRGVVLPEALRKEVNASTRHFILGTAPNVTGPGDVPEMAFRDNGWSGALL